MATLQTPPIESPSDFECVLPDLAAYFSAAPHDLVMPKNRRQTRYSGFLRGFVSVNPFGAGLNSKPITPTPGADAVPDTWFSVGKALFTAILDFRSSKQPSARPSESDLESTK